MTRHWLLYPLCLPTHSSTHVSSHFQVAFFTESASTQTVYSRSVCKIMMISHKSYEMFVTAHPRQVGMGMVCSQKGSRQKTLVLVCAGSLCSFSFSFTTSILILTPSSLLSLCQVQALLGNLRKHYEKVRVPGELETDFMSP